VQGWSEKECVIYVQPPVAVLESLVAVRAHLDDCGPESGPLRVVPRSHRHGRLSADAAKALRERHGESSASPSVVERRRCAPLLLHSSSKARPDHAVACLQFCSAHRTGMRTEVAKCRLTDR